MSFRDFTFPEVNQQLGLTLQENSLFEHVSPISLTGEFAERIRSGVDLALAVNTEKARSEFIIAPVLFELRRLLAGRFALFSGVEFNVDPNRGLNGFCDFVLTRSPLQSVLTAPVVAITEAKNDNVRNGLGQCIASMVAAWEFNGKNDEPVYGIATTGSAWKFLKLTNTILVLDVREYFIAEVGQILGVLQSILTTRG